MQSTALQLLLDLENYVVRWTNTLRIDGGKRVGKDEMCSASQGFRLSDFPRSSLSGCDVSVDCSTRRNRNPTSKFLRSWSSHQRLKRGSTFRHVVASSIEHHSLSQIIDPSENLDGVYVHVDLSIQVSKQKELPCYLKQLSLERINIFPKDAVHMYTDGSKLRSECSGSGIYIIFRDQEIEIKRKNPDSGSVFRSELVAIREGLNSIESLPQLHDIWIFSNSRINIQYLANWHNVRDRRGTDILKILKRLSLSRQIHFQWIPSHVNIAGNEIAYSLARAGAGKTTTPAAPLTYLELF
ncbi:RNase H domain-containing protein [Trichonephila clavipes]|uniref:RNase H domain-containing protein n=1 Tax=Trichonephila clavipes TaxID=2585209 RepID=A0A8X6VS01_TRICX|nr:RNase H domain-containing protein [Trichonephila clavipes]